MQEVSLSLQTVTQLFLGGADQDDEPELRAPSFRGLMRVWLRAMVAGCLWDGNNQTLSSIRREEEALFGSTARGSAVTLRLWPEDLQETLLFEKEKPEHINGKPQPTGRDYLLWSLDLGEGKGKRSYYPEGSTFSLALQVRGQDKTSLKKAVAALWLLVYLGGLGARSRRCAGSLAVNRIDRWEIEGWAKDFLLPPATPAAFHLFLKERLHAIRGLWVPTPPPLASAFPPLDLLTPFGEACRIWMLQGAGPWASAEQALYAIGAKLRDFRTYSPPDHDNVAPWLQGHRSISTVQRAIFGLPIPFRYTKGPRGVIDGQAHKRRASPLLLRVARLGGGKRYVGVAVLFKSQFLPPGELLKSKDQTNSHASPVFTDPPPDYSLIERWIDTFEDVKEVTDW